jgi:hypothetical protein
MAVECESLIRRSLLLSAIATCVVLLHSHPFGQIGVVPTGAGRLESISDSKYRVGDLWEYRTRSGEEHSRFTVVKVENSSKLGVIVHIGVDNLIWKTCKGEDLAERVPHMPFTRKAVDTSAIRRVATGHSLPAFQEGYEEWRQAFLRGHAGIYTISVGDAISVAEKTWRSGIGCDNAAR